MDISKQRVLIFCPEKWGTVERFARFHQSTYSFDRHVQKRLRGISGNFGKAHRYLEIARDLVLRLDEDERQLEEKGHTHAFRAKQLAAAVEGAFCSLYSTLDCFRHVLVAIYKNHRGMRDSTRKVFQAGHKRELDQRVPQTIRDLIFETKSWFNEFRGYRDEMTHADVGSCHRDAKTGSIVYMHSDLGSPTKALVIEDVFTKVEALRDMINQFLGAVFAILNTTLKDVETQQFCGIFGGLFYERMVKPSEATNFNGGTCKSLDWFDEPGAQACPLKDRCGAYANARRHRDGASVPDSSTS
jgi:hypothetical protein